MTMNVQKIQRNGGFLGLIHFNIYVKNRKWQRIESKEAWTSEAGNGNAPCTVSTDTTTVTTNDGHNAAVVIKQTVNTWIWIFSILFGYIVGLVSILDVVQYSCLIKMQQLFALLYTCPSKM